MVGVLLAVGAVGAATWTGNGFVGRHQVLDRAHYEEQYADSSLEAFDEDINRFPQCDDRYERLGADLWCYQTARANVAAPGMALLGDSHARSLFPGVADAVTRAAGGRVLLVSRCAPLLDVKIADQPDCVDVNAAIVKELASDSGISIVVLASRGALYTSGKGFGAVEAVGTTLEAVAPRTAGESRSELLEHGYAATISALERAGKTVVVAIDVPGLGFSPADCLFARPYERSPQALRVPCALAREDVRARQADYLEVLHRLNRAHPALEIFDPTDILCDETLCYGARNGRFLYADTNHLGRYGSTLTGAALVTALAIGPQAVKR